MVYFDTIQEWSNQSLVFFFIRSFKEFIKAKVSCLDDIVYIPIVKKIFIKSSYYYKHLPFKFEFNFIIKCSLYRIFFVSLFSYRCQMECNLLTEISSKNKKMIKESVKSFPNNKQNQQVTRKVSFHNYKNKRFIM